MRGDPLPRRRDLPWREREHERLELDRGQPVAEPPPPYQTRSDPDNDYLVEEERGRAAPPLVAQLLRLLAGLLLLVLAAISFGLFWVVAKMLNLL